MTGMGHKRPPRLHLPSESHSLEHALACWAKLSTDEKPPTYHPLLCHMIDVAMVALEMWRRTRSPRYRCEMTKALGFGKDEDTAGLWCAFLAGLHDLGKASPAFQLQVGRVRQEVKERLLASSLWVPKVYGLRHALHGTITSATLPGILKTTFGLDDQTSAHRVGVIVGGHHGTFPTSLQIGKVSSIDIGKDDWDKHRHALVEHLAAAVGVPSDKLPCRFSNATALTLAGFVSVADWIGSNQDFFPCTSHPLSVAAYTHDATLQARKALDKLGWLMNPPQHEVRGFAELFPHLLTPNDLQNFVGSLAPKLQGQGMVIIEVPMGEGKTEAALYLADCWTSSSGHSGTYFALPTQATSNQMFGRVRHFLEDRYKDHQVQLQLLHGHAALSSEFKVLRYKSGHLLAPQYSGVEDGGDHAVLASEWFTHRKRGLLAPFGVGTIDQALLAALQTKHSFVRLFGLAHKTVIVDEVHAYDAYMTTLLERLLEWLGALGSSVVLLSATLPKNQRQALFEAYTRGLGHQPKDSISWANYPRVSWVTGNSETSSRMVQVSPRGKKEVLLGRTDGSTNHLCELLSRALEQGGCAAVVCNTVRRAQEIYSALKSYFLGTDEGALELDILHSQYLFQDREEREQRALSRFGKPNDPGVRRPHRAVLVATQVIEQSLDLDFDMMVSDMAPADLLLQRIGRLHRHERPRPLGLARPQLIVCEPYIDNAVPQFEPGTSAIYSPHILLRSWLTLRERHTICVPDDVETIISDVYDDQQSSDLSNPLREEWERSKKVLERDRIEYQHKARLNSILPPTDPTEEILEQSNRELEEANPEMHETLQALTRLSHKTVPVILVKEQERQHLDTLGIEKILRRSVSISHGGVVTTLLSNGQAPDHWHRNPLLRHHHLIVLNNEGEAIIGTYIMCLDPELGVRISKWGKAGS